MVFLDVLAHLWLAKTLAAHCVDRSDVVFAPLVDFLVGFARVICEYLFALEFIFWYGDIDCFGLLDRDLLGRLGVFGVFGFGGVWVGFEDVGVVELVEIKHEFGKE